MEDAGALAIYAVAWIGLVGRKAVADPTGTCACQGNGDPTAYMWALEWWPHAFLNGLNPFVSEVIWAPEGGNVASSALMPGASLLLWPVTEALGPLFSYNLLTFLASVLAAWFTFRLCRHITGRWLPSLVGGYVFGFSSYVLGHSLGHVNLILVFLVPAAVHLALLWLDGQVSNRRFVVLMTVVITLQFLLSTEVVLTGLLAGGAALILAYVVSPPRRRRIREMVPLVLVAGAISAVVVSPDLYYAIKGVAPNSSVNWMEKAAAGSADPLNYALPTPVAWVHPFTDSVAAKFNERNYSESTAYIGLPLLLIVAMFGYRHWRRPSVKVLLGVLLVVFVASLGAHLHVLNPPGPGASYSPSIPLPWIVADHLPVLDHVLPARLSLFAFLIVAIIVAAWLSEPTRRSWARWLLAGAGILLLLPNQALPYWKGQPETPPFFTDGLYRKHLEPDETVLVFPYAFRGNSMLWQAETGMYFRMAGGYISPDVPSGYWSDPVARILLYPSEMGPVTPERLGLPLRDFIVRRGVGAVIIGPGSPDVWSPVLESQGLRPTSVGGVDFYDVPSRWGEPASSQAAPNTYRLAKRGTERVLVGPSEVAQIVDGEAAGYFENVRVEGRTVSLGGWAASRAGPAERVVAFAGGRFLAEGAPTRARPDIAGAFGPEALLSGFSLLGVFSGDVDSSAIRVFALRDGRAVELKRLGG